jgi:hypothetical protein
LCHIFSCELYYIDDALAVYEKYFSNLDFLLKNNSEIKKAKVVGLKNVIMNISMTRWMSKLSTEESLKQYTEYINKFIVKHDLKKEDSLEHLSDIIKYCFDFQYIKGLNMFHLYIGVPTQLRENADIKKKAGEVICGLLQNGFIGDAKILIEIFNVDRKIVEEYFKNGLLHILKYKDKEKSKSMKYFFHERLVNIIGWYVESGYLSEQFINTELVKELGLDFHLFLIEMNELQLASKLKKDLNLLV